MSSSHQSGPATQRRVAKALELVAASKAVRGSQDGEQQSKDHQQQLTGLLRKLRCGHGVGSLSSRGLESLALKVMRGETEPQRASSPLAPVTPRGRASAQAQSGAQRSAPHTRRRSPVTSIQERLERARRALDMARSSMHPAAGAARALDYTAPTAQALRSTSTTDSEEEERDDGAMTAGGWPGRALCIKGMPSPSSHHTKPQQTLSKLASQSGKLSIPHTPSLKASRGACSGKGHLTAGSDNQDAIIAQTLAKLSPLRSPTTTARRDPKTAQTPGYVSGGAGATASRGQQHASSAASQHERGPLTSSLHPTSGDASESSWELTDTEEGSEGAHSDMTHTTPAKSHTAGERTRRTGAQVSTSPLSASSAWQRPPWQPSLTAAPMLLTAAYNDEEKEADGQWQASSALAVTSSSRAARGAHDAVAPHGQGGSQIEVVQGEAWVVAELRAMLASAREGLAEERAEVARLHRLLDDDARDAARDTAALEAARARGDALAAALDAERMEVAELRERVREQQDAARELHTRLSDTKAEAARVAAQLLAVEAASVSAAAVATSVPAAVPAPACARQLAYGGFEDSSRGSSTSGNGPMDAHARSQVSVRVDSATDASGVTAPDDRAALQHALDAAQEELAALRAQVVEARREALAAQLACDAAVAEREVLASQVAALTDVVGQHSTDLEALSDTAMRLGMGNTAIQAQLEARLVQYMDQIEQYSAELQAMEQRYGEQADALTCAITRADAAELEATTTAAALAAAEAARDAAIARATTLNQAAAAVEVHHMEAAELQVRYTALEQQLAVLQSQAASLRAERSTLLAQLGDAQSDLQARRARASSTEGHAAKPAGDAPAGGAAAATLEADAARREAAALREEMRELRTSLAASVAVQRAEGNELAQQLAAAQAEAVAAHAHAAAMSQALDAAQAQVEAARKELEGVRAEGAAAAREAAGMRAEAQAGAQRARVLEAQCRQLDAERSRLAGEQTRLAGLLEVAEAKVAEATAVPMHMARTRQVGSSTEAAVAAVGCQATALAPVFTAARPEVMEAVLPAAAALPATGTWPLSSAAAAAAASSLPAAPAPLAHITAMPPALPSLILDSPPGRAPKGAPSAAASTTTAKAVLPIHQAGARQAAKEEQGEEEDGDEGGPEESDSGTAEVGEDIAEEVEEEEGLAAHGPATPSSPLYLGFTQTLPLGAKERPHDKSGQSPASPLAASSINVPESGSSTTGASGSDIPRPRTSSSNGSGLPRPRTSSGSGIPAIRVSSSGGPARRTSGSGAGTVKSGPGGQVWEDAEAVDPLNSSASFAIREVCGESDTSPNPSPRDTPAEGTSARELDTRHFPLSQSVPPDSITLTPGSAGPSGGPADAEDDAGEVSSPRLVHVACGSAHTGALLPVASGPSPPPASPVAAPPPVSAPDSSDLVPSLPASQLLKKPLVPASQLPCAPDKGAAGLPPLRGSRLPTAPGLPPKPRPAAGSCGPTGGDGVGDDSLGNSGGKGLSGDIFVSLSTSMDGPWGVPTGLHGGASGTAEERCPDDLARNAGAGTEVVSSGAESPVATPAPTTPPKPPLGTTRNTSQQTSAGVTGVGPAVAEGVPGFYSHAQPPRAIGNPVGSTSGGVRRSTPSLSPQTSVKTRHSHSLTRSGSLGGAGAPDGGERTLRGSVSNMSGVSRGSRRRRGASDSGGSEDASTVFDYEEFECQGEEDAEIVADEDDWVIAHRASEPSTPFSGPPGTPPGQHEASGIRGQRMGRGACVGEANPGDAGAGAAHEGVAVEVEGEAEVPEWLRRQDELLAEIDSFG